MRHGAWHAAVDFPWGKPKAARMVRVALKVFGWVVAGALLGAGSCSPLELLEGEDQRTMECGASRSAEVQGRTGMAECNALPEFGVSCLERFVIPAAAADIIVVVDSSLSMKAELRDVREQLNAFAQKVAQSGLDYRVIMVGSRGHNDQSICVPPPLAGPGCGDAPRFRHVDAYVDSTNGPSVLISHWTDLRDFVRADAAHAIVFVTDDNSDMSAREFLDQSVGLTGLDGATVHAVVGLNPTDCPDITLPGLAYVQLAAITGGLAFPICCADYSQLFDALAVDTAASVRRFVLSRQVSQPQSIRVFLEDDTGARTPITTGWTYDAEVSGVQFDEGALPPPESNVVITYGSR